MEEVVVDGEDEEEMIAALYDKAGTEALRHRIAAEESSTITHRAWDPRNIDESEELECDLRAYSLLQYLGLDWPCLSFDIIPDDLGGGRTTFPHSLVLVCGSQAESTNKNALNLIRLSDLGAVKLDDDEEDDDDRVMEDDEEEEEDDEREPIVERCFFDHPGCVNRVAASAERGVVATWSEDGHVRVFDFRETASAYCQHGISRRPNGRILTSSRVLGGGNTISGYALAWSSLARNKLATGNDSGSLSIFHVDTANVPVLSFATDKSLEDIAWSPTETSVLVTVGCDQSIRVFDDRHSNGPMLTRPNAHTNDINALSWNSAVSYLLATAGDDGFLQIWDLRAFGTHAAPVGTFNYHQKPITALQWDPHDEAALICSSEDHSITHWDLAVEDDDTDQTTADATLAGLPPQLLFVHQGLHYPKDVKHHPQIPNLVISSDYNGLSVYIPALAGKERATD
uniref:Histone-binding protein RBBP4-like N-terminal domain-containing protein n=1 Tax=Aureoumbra lagunensis TaxID=44058 RepID=A0A7S3JWR5_9STRA